ncbi:hypothetical protein [Geothrix sp. PMB-07]|uniref:hypothetical protein n=1 Tax=Geothrix sp. PMB-07 TaxID=3068640 RepID=UPI002740CA9F|nr:hypothetical protein [Geothrix sp. PMB-07]WLT30293.1 hypothetical protein Q9293_11245 [Geothrix sp. PMB-07]
MNSRSTKIFGLAAIAIVIGFGLGFYVKQLNHKNKQQELIIAKTNQTKNEINNIDVKLLQISSDQQDLMQKWNDFIANGFPDDALIRTTTDDGSFKMITVSEKKDDLRRKYAANEAESKSLNQRRLELASTIPGELIPTQAKNNQDQSIHISLESNTIYKQTMSDIGCPISTGNRLYLNNVTFKIYVDSIMAMKNQREQASNNFHIPILPDSNEINNIYEARKIVMMENSK